MLSSLNSLKQYNTVGNATPSGFQDKTPMPAALAVDRVSKIFPGRAGARPLEVLQSVSFCAEPGEFISIIGPSGCGKTTLMRIVHGLEEATCGQHQRGRPAGHGSGPDARSHLPALQSVSLAHGASEHRLRTRSAAAGRDAAADRVQEMIKLVGLVGFEEHYPHEISGGMQQRVGIARAFALDPTVLLMDEPFGALDAITREKLQREIAEILSPQHKTTLFITHNMDEAIFFSDRILVFGTRPGRIVEEVKVPFARPREADVVRASREFAELREHLWALLSRELAA